MSSIHGCKPNPSASLKRQIRRFALSLTVTVASACTPVAPVPPAPRSAMPVRASFDRTWSSVIDVFASKNIPIRTLDRSSGFIATDQLSVPILIGGKPHPWADCGKASIGGYFPPTNATYNIRVKGDASSSNVLVTVLWRYSPATSNSPFGGLGGSGLDCTTKGVWEPQTESEIKVLAEGK